MTSHIIASLTNVLQESSPILEQMRYGCDLIHRRATGRWVGGHRSRGAVFRDLPVHCLSSNALNDALRALRVTSPPARFKSFASSKSASAIAAVFEKQWRAPARRLPGDLLTSTPPRRGTHHRHDLLALMGVANKSPFALESIITARCYDNVRIIGAVSHLDLQVGLDPRCDLNMSTEKRERNFMLILEWLRPAQRALHVFHLLHRVLRVDHAHLPAQCHLQGSTANREVCKEMAFNRGFYQPVPRHWYSLASPSLPGLPDRRLTLFHACRRPPAFVTSPDKHASSLSQPSGHAALL